MGLPWTGAADEALRLFAETHGLPSCDGVAWSKLALALYDAGHYPEALEVFTQTEKHTSSKALLFGAHVWKGHIFDLMGRRDEALVSYQQALKINSGAALRNDQYGFLIDHRWVKERLQVPFVRRASNISEGTA
jgi:tetratricopeptide (TPR) repeat protein